MEVINKCFYTCQICGKTSAIKEKIQECEQSHVGIDVNEPISVEYEKTRARSKYPKYIDVKMQDGATAHYYLNYVDGDD